MLVRLRDRLDPYHQRRADKHGRLFVVVRHTEPDFPAINLYEAKSISTGAVCTLDPLYLEHADG